jgi:non-heme chloroperoxidase
MDIPAEYQPPDRRNPAKKAIKPTAFFIHYRPMKSPLQLLFLLLFVTVPGFCRVGSIDVSDHTFTASDGVTLHYLEAGQGPTLVFIPGWTMPANIWQNQIDFFSTHYQVVALDPRCQGKSQITNKGLTVLRRAQDIHELLGQLKSPKTVLVGWSMGGSEVLAALGRYSLSDLAGVVLVDAPPGLAPTEVQILKRQELIQKLQDNRQKETDSFVRWMYHKPQSEAYLIEMEAAALKTPTPAAVALLQDLYTVSNWRPDYSRIKLPVICFASDSYASQGTWLKTKIKGMKLKPAPGAGHALFVDEADFFNQQTQKFLDDIGFTDKTL